MQPFFFQLPSAQDVGKIKTLMGQIMVSWRNFLHRPEKTPRNQLLQLVLYWEKVKYTKSLSLYSLHRGEEGHSPLVESHRALQLFQDQSCFLLLLLLGLASWHWKSSAGLQPLLKPSGRRHKRSSAAKAILTPGVKNQCAFSALLFVLHSHSSLTGHLPFPSLLSAPGVSSGVWTPAIAM